MEPITYTPSYLATNLSVASGTSNAALTTTSGTTLGATLGTTTYYTPNTWIANTPISQSINLTFTNQIMQNKVAVFKVTRDEDQKITKTEFIKELWVETKNGQSVDFQVARDKDLAEYEMSDLSIKTIFSLTF
jgi:hypothetical protein